MPVNSSHRPDLLDEVTLLDEPGCEQLRCRFSGLFEGKAVEWCATLYTPEAWAKAFAEKRPEQNIIDIAETEPPTIRLCLQVERIDRPTVRKAVMMVRQYKRLRRGIHRYGGG